MRTELLLIGTAWDIHSAWLEELGVDKKTKVEALDPGDRDLPHDRHS